MKEFNLALLIKWCWRLHDEHHSLWYNVLEDRYGTENRHVRDDECLGYNVCIRLVERLENDDDDYLL